MNSQMLQEPIFDKSVKLQVDANDIDIRGVWILEDDRGIDHPIWYVSRNLTNTTTSILVLRKERWICCYICKKLKSI